MLEREKGFEPSTLALARRCSTTELFPLANDQGRSVLTSPVTVKPRILCNGLEQFWFGYSLSRYEYVT